MKTQSEMAELALRLVREAPLIAFDVETSGVDYKRNATIGYVVTASDGAGGYDNCYVPIRHGGGGNLNDAPPLEKAEVERPMPVHYWEMELAKAFKERNRKGFITAGHNLKFDCHFAANHGVMLGRNLMCTQLTEAIINEHLGAYSLSACCKRHGVSEKLGDELYVHTAHLFGGEPDRKQMQHYWRLAGDDRLAVEYAMGDGVSTLELYHSQMEEINKVDQWGNDLKTVHKLEMDLVWTVFRMERIGIKIDVDRIEQVKKRLAEMEEEARRALPPGFNVRSTAQVKGWLESQGITEFPRTEPTARFPEGQVSIRQGWLESQEIGKPIVAVRKIQDLSSKFITPLEERHLFEGRVHATLYQLPSDDYGTIGGRFSCAEPNLQQLSSRDKLLGRLLRSVFIPDDGMEFVEADLSQCLAAGTQVMVPGGTKNIEDMKPGDLVYSFDEENDKVCLRKVTWAGQTGVRPVCEVKWRSSHGKTGVLVATFDHRFYLYDGGTISVEEMLRKPAKKGAKHKYAHRLKALSRHKDVSERATWRLHPSGKRAMLESRLVFEDFYGWLPEQVHHKDGDRFNNHPDNLEGTSDAEHREKHRPNDVDPHEIVRLLERGLFKTEVAKELGCTVHAVEYWRSKLIPGHVITKGAGRINVDDVRYLWNRGVSASQAARILGCSPPSVTRRYKQFAAGVVTTNSRAAANKFDRASMLQMLAEGASLKAVANAVGCSRRLVSAVAKEAANHVVYEITPLTDAVPVYCITVEGTHNFYSEEVLSVNCEPRLFSHFTKNEALLKGYNSTPYIDMHTTMSKMLGIERDLAKRVGMALLTGQSLGGFARHMEWPLDKAKPMYDAYFKEFPELRAFHADARNAYERRGFVRSLIGRKMRLDDIRYSYRAVSRIIQANNAEVMKWYMREADQLCEAEGDEVNLLMTVHDSIVLQAPLTDKHKKIADDVITLFERVQQPPFNLKVPFVMDVGRGANWGIAKFGPEKK
jgi:DNA polymerase I-like protein with 3'-5' exonuclease and polymerase domains